MISKAQLDQISFIYENIVEKDYFSSCLVKKLLAFQNNKRSRAEFNSWLDSWAATAELDQDRECARRIRGAYKQVKSKSTKYKSWEQFSEKKSNALPFSNTGLSVMPLMLLSGCIG